jgi:hypothetical protein
MGFTPFRCGENFVAASDASTVQNKIDGIQNGEIGRVGVVAEPVGDTAQKVVAVMRRYQRGGACHQIELIVGERER